MEGCSRASNQLFHLDTKGACLICLRPVGEAGSEEGVAPWPPGTSYSLRNICRHLKLDMEMVQLLINHGEEAEAQKSDHKDPTPANGIPPPDLKVTLCQACGVVATRFSELFRKQELIRMEMGSCLGVVGGLLAEADKDVPLMRGFHKRMTTNISPRSFLCLRAVEELRKEMGEKCGMEVAKKYPAPVTEEIDRVARESLGNSGSGNEARAPGRAPHGSGSRKKLQRKGPSPMPGSGRTIQACTPLPPNPAPRRSLLCNQCGSTFKFPETLRAHLEIVHGLEMLKQEELIKIAPNVPKPGKGRRKLNLGTEAEYLFNPETGRYDCPLCSKNFASLCTSQKHFRTSHLMIRYPCEECGKTFTSKMGRNYHHQFKHMGIRVKCDLCDATFTHPSRLCNHRQSVHFGKWYSCHYCSKRFPKPCARNSHMKRCWKGIFHQP